MTLLLLNLSPLFSLTTLKYPTNVSTSIIIPCHYSHVHFLEETLEKYANNTVIPDEVVISISLAHKAKTSEIEQLRSRDWPFKLILVISDERISEGGNRNIAFKHSSGDVIICSDADDLPHIRRVEIIKHYFDHFDVMFLFSNLNPGFPVPEEIKDIPWSIPKTHNDPISLTNGVPSFRRIIGEKYQWKTEFRRGVDIEFNENVFKDYPDKIMAIFADIYNYRIQHSTYGQKNFSDKKYFMSKDYRPRSQDETCDYLIRDIKIREKETIYKKAYELATRKDLKSVVCLGCGNGRSFMEYFEEFDTLGFELKNKLEQLKMDYPNKKWKETHYGNFPDVFKIDLLICNNLLEAVTFPDEILNFINLYDFKYLVISGTDRVKFAKALHKNPADSKNGPPFNTAHVREWSFNEFKEYISHHFDIVEHFNGDPDFWDQFIIATKKW